MAAIRTPPLANAVIPSLNFDFDNSAVMRFAAIQAAINVFLRYRDAFEIGVAVGAV